MKKKLKTEKKDDSADDTEALVRVFSPRLEKNEKLRFEAARGLLFIT